VLLKLGEMTLLASGFLMKVQVKPSKILLQMAGPLRIGLDSNNLYPAKGIIDEVGVFNVALPLNGIEKIMTSGLKSTTAVFPSSKLTATWGSIKNR